MTIAELAHLQLLKEIDAGTRVAKITHWKGKEYHDYSMLDFLDTIVKIRKWFDKHSRKGNFDRALYGDSFANHQQYLKIKH